MDYCGLALAFFFESIIFTYHTLYQIQPSYYSDIEKIY